MVLQSREINALLRKDCPVAWRLLSERGRKMYFPRSGILAQTAEARGSLINATIGVALEDNGKPMALPSIMEGLPFSSSQVVSYAPIAGDPELRERWMERLRRKNPTLCSHVLSLPVVVGGLTHGLSILGGMFVDPGDDIIVPTPSWENYDLIFDEFFGGHIQSFPLFSGTQFNMRGLQKTLMQRGKKKVLLLNFPNNPTGYSPLREEVRGIVGAIYDAARVGKDIVVIVDDAYAGLVYEEGVYRDSFFGELANLHERVLAAKVDGASKEDYGWGLRLAFVTFAAKGMGVEGCRVLEEKTSGMVRRTISNCSTLSQQLLLRAMRNPSYIREQKRNRAVLQARFARLKEALVDARFAGVFRPLPCNSGYFVCVELRDGIDGEMVRRALLERYGVGVISLRGNLLRIAFSSVAEKDIGLLFDHLYDVCSSLSFPHGSPHTSRRVTARCCSR